MQQAYNFTVVQFRRRQWRPLAQMGWSFFEVEFVLLCFHEIYMKYYSLQSFKISHEDARVWIWQAAGLRFYPRLLFGSKNTWTQSKIQW